MTFYVVEGPDGAGKSEATAYLCRMITEKTGTAPLKLHFPNRDTEIGKLIDSCLRGERSISPLVLHQLFSANRLESQHVIKAALDAGQSVVADRYMWSGAAYTMAQCAEATEQWCFTHEIMSRAPDFVFYLRANPLLCMKRFKERGEGEELYEKGKFLVKVIKKFDRLFEGDSLHASAAIEEAFSRTRICAIDADQELEFVQKQLLSALEDSLEGM